MHLPKFEQFRPDTIKDVTRLLDEYGPRTRLVAGGTDLFPRMKYGLDRPEVVVSLKGIPVKAPELKEGGALYLDALTPLADLVRSPLVLENAVCHLSERLESDRFPVKQRYAGLGHIQERLVDGFEKLLLEREPFA